MQPKVTIGIPLYNEEKYIEETVKSASNQSYENIEILISDNGSTDGSLEIVKRIALSDSRIKIVSHTQNKGPFFNFKYLLDNAKGEYFIWLGGHDVMLSSFIEEAADTLNKDKSICAIFPKVYEILDDNIEEKFIHAQYRFKNPDDIGERLIQLIKTKGRGSAVHSVYRISVLRKSLTDIDGGDLMIFLKAATYGKFVESEHLALYMRNVRPSESSTDQKNRYKAYGFKDNWRVIRYMFPFGLILSLDSLSFKEKIQLFSKVRKEMAIHGAYGTRKIFLYYLYRGEFKVSLVSLLERIMIK